MIGKGQVVINRFRDADGLQLIAAVARGKCEAMGAISRIVAADVDQGVNVKAA